jgi:hypothetical protein
MSSTLSPNSQQLFHGTTTTKRTGYTVVFAQTVRYERFPDPAYPDRKDKFIFNYDNMLPPYRRTFDSHAEYIRWRDHVATQANVDDLEADDRDAFFDQQEENEEAALAVEFYN